MLGLILLYWIGKYFYKLAEKYDKIQWGFAILGIVVYYAGLFLAAILMGIILELVSPGYIDTINEHLFGLMALPFGILSCYILYRYLEKKWGSADFVSKKLIDQIGSKEE